MNLDDARSLLGIDPSTDAAAARRAYLRLLKQHPPERDPEGFKRVRAAYEAVQPFLRTAGEPPLPESLPLRPLPADVGRIEAQPPFDELPAGADPEQAAPAPSLTELVWNEEDPAAQESMARAAVAREHSEEAYSLLLDVLENRGSEAEQLQIAREAVQYGHGEFLLTIGQRWPDALSDAELHTLRERAVGGPDWAHVASILVERGHAASAAEFALSELAREKATPFAPRAGSWWLTRLVAGLLGSPAITPALQVFEAVASQPKGEDGGMDPVRLLLLRELASIRSQLPDDVARVMAKSIESGDMTGAELDLAAFAGSAKKGESASLRHLLKSRAPTLSSYYDKSLEGVESRFRAPWYRRSWGGRTWGFLILFNILRLCIKHYASDTPSASDVQQVQVQTSPATPDVEQPLCEEPGLLCEAARRWSRAEGCGDLRAAFEDLQRAYLLSNKTATPSLRQQIAYSEAIKATTAHCPLPFRREARHE